MSITYKCGCVNQMDPQWGVERSISKCASHAAMSGKTGMAYYHELGTVIDGVPQCSKYVDELVEGMPDCFSTYLQDCKVLEVGCGFSMYAPWLLRRGADYRGIDLDPAAAAATAMAYCVRTLTGRYEELSPAYRFDVILAAHCVEHFEDAPAALQRMFDHLNTDGRLWIIVPDNSDPLNPDHLWFFTPASITNVLQSIGFKDIQTSVRKRIERENFIYVGASK